MMKAKHKMNKDEANDLKRDERKNLKNFTLIRVQN